ncbi:MAG: HAMP domain-containing histidine kinase [Hyphomonadaceae bacterium]|nr:HAMP domain-containing histidine kinase [Hyphomonadaceae bacterium]
MVWTGWAWLGVSGGLALVAWANGADVSRLGAAAALAIAPAFAGFILLPFLGRKFADAALIAVWTITAAGLIAGAGGVASPLAVMLAIGPALALALRRPWAPEAGAGAVLAYAAAALLARFEPADAAARLGPYPETLSVAALAFAAAMMALGAPTKRGGGALMSQRVAEVSHELRTPLTHILGFSEMIERQIFGPLETRYVEYAGLIRKSGGHLLGLVNDLLDLSRIEAGRYDIARAEFDVAGVIEDVVRLSADAAAKKQIAIGIVTPDRPLMVRADDRALRRILINTVGNAIKFTPEGGKVIVQAQAREGALDLDTIDNGPGIPEAEREVLGEAFERGSGGARAEGTGLGLSLVRALAGLHGGTLSFHDAPGGGALVRVRLPVLA